MQTKFTALLSVIENIQCLSLIHDNASRYALFAIRSGETRNSLWIICFYLKTQILTVGLYTRSTFWSFIERRQIHQYIWVSRKSLLTIRLRAMIDVICVMSKLISLKCNYIFTEWWKPRRKTYSRILISTSTGNVALSVSQFIICILSGFPLGLENLENLEKWEGIFQSGKSQGILNRLEKSGKSQGKSHKILENWDKLR